MMQDVQAFLRQLSPALVVDVETGGLDPSTAPILEVAVGVVLDGYLGDVLRWRVLPYADAPIDPEAVALVGFTGTAGWARQGAVSEEEALGQLDQHLRGFPAHRAFTWIGHNTPFDRAMLRAASARAGVRFLGEACGHRDIDTMAIATVAQATGIVSSRSLEALTTAAGLRRKEPRIHRADEDVRLTWAVLGWLLAHLRWVP